jgi:curved DNA-binding protein CbpA
MPSSKSLYEVLGVTQQASNDQIKSAFRRMVRERHPDRFQGMARAAAELAFQEITEAYNVLTDPIQRRRYDQQLAGEAKEQLTDPKEISRALLAKAINLAKSGQPGPAEECFIQAVGYDQQSAKAHHLFAMFLGQQPERLDEALRHLDQAVKLDSNNVKLLLDASRMFARGQMFARAARLAQSAAQLSPGDPAVETWLAQLRGFQGRG